LQDLKEQAEARLKESLALTQKVDVQGGLQIKEYLFEDEDEDELDCDKEDEDL
jgi:hypothetical protein